MTSYWFTSQLEWNVHNSGWFYTLFLSPASEWLSPEATANTSSEEMCQSKQVYRSKCTVLSLNTIRCMTIWPVCLEELLLYQSITAGIAEALLTCVFQGSVIWNSQMSPWQMNGNAGVMEVGIHALYRLSLCVHQGCWGLWCNSVSLFGP